MGKEKLELNYEILLQTQISSLQKAHMRYIKAVKESLDMYSFNNNGELLMIEGYEEKSKEIEECKKEVQRLWREVNRLKNRKTPNWSGVWINREEALIRFDDRISEYREYTNDYEHGKFDAYLDAEDVIADLDGHD